jgi:hypothetical protein
MHRLGPDISSEPDPEVEVKLDADILTKSREPDVLPFTVIEKSISIFF